MSFGAKIKNDDQDILIDSDFGHYHFLGKADYVSTTRVPNIVGGNFTAHSPTNYTTLANSQVNGDIIKYEINCDDGFVPPMCFIKPSTVGDTAPPCSIILTKLVFGNFYKWEIWVLQRRDGSASSPTSYTRPTLYCFHPVDLWGSPRANIAVGEEKIGVRMYNSSEVVTFDTRLKPLKVIKTQTITAPSIARTSSPDNNSFAPNFTPNGTKNYNHGLSDTTDLMYYAPSLAHSCQQAYQERDGEGFQSGGYSDSDFYAWVRADLWWCFYRNTFRLTSSQLQSNYSIYASGHVWEADEDSSSIFAVAAGILLGTITGGAALGVIGGFIVANDFNLAGVTASSYYPYVDSSRNTSEDVQVVFSRPSYYD